MVMRAIRMEGSESGEREGVLWREAGKVSLRR